MKKLFSKNRKFGGADDASAMSTQELSYHGKIDDLKNKLTQGSTVEGDYIAGTLTGTTNIQAALKGIVENKKKGLAEPGNQARMDIIMYLIENGAKTDYLLTYLKQYPLPREFLTAWMDRLLNMEGQDDLVENLAEILSAPESSTPGQAMKDYKAEINAIFVSKTNTEPDAPKKMLFSVAKDGSPENMTKLILNYRQDINTVNESGKTPIIVAAENGNVGVVKVLFENKNISDNLLPNKQDKEGNTAFIAACNAQPVNKELVEYLAGKLDADALVIKKELQGSGYQILLSHKKEIDNEIKSPTYATTKTPAQKAADKAQLDVLNSLMTTVNNKLPKEARAQTPEQREEQVAENKKKILKGALVEYINTNFKDKYLQFIDTEMKNSDPKWAFISSCKKYAFSRCKPPADLDAVKKSLYSQLAEYYRETKERIDFKTVLNTYVLSGIDNADKGQVLGTPDIFTDIENSEKELSAFYPEAPVSWIKNPFAGGSRRGKKRSASKTRKQKKQKK